MRSAQYHNTHVQDHDVCQGAFVSDLIIHINRQSKNRQSIYQENKAKPK